MGVAQGGQLEPGACLARQLIVYQAGGLAFPKLGGAAGRAWLAYGAPGRAARLPAHRPLAPCGPAGRAAPRRQRRLLARGWPPRRPPFLASPGEVGRHFLLFWLAFAGVWPAILPATQALQSP